MTRSEANRYISDYYYNNNPSEDDKFLFVEAHRFLIDTYHDPRDMHNLAFFYLEQRRHDLEQKYLEMAAEYKYPPALEDLGYIWYYGQNGEVDYKKAFEYFSLASESGDDVVKAWSLHKLADMYHNGFYVNKDETKYRQMIEDLYDWIMNPGELHSMYPQPELRFPFSDVFYRLAKIRANQGRVDEAMKLLHDARVRLSEDIRDNPSWWGDIEVIERVVRLEHELDQGNSRRFNIYDLCWIADAECKVAFLYHQRRFIVEVTNDPDSVKNVIKYDGKWYRTVREFLEKAELDGKKLVFLYDVLYNFEVNYG